MKSFSLPILVGTSIACVAAVSAAVIMWGGKLPDVISSMDQNGLKSLKVDNVELLESGTFKVERVSVKKADGTLFAGMTAANPSVDREHQTVIETFPWGKVEASYRSAKNRLTITMVTTNTSDSETIQSVNYFPLALRFPEKVKEYDGSTPLLAHNVGQVAAFKISYGSGTLAVVAEDVAQPLMVGFPWASNRPTNTKFPLSVHTGRVDSYPDSYPTIERPIPPRGTDSYAITLRFGRSDATETALDDDIYKQFAKTFPLQSTWPDRRPIGAIFLASSMPEHPATNPRGWFGDPQLNVQSPTGQAEFRRRLLNLADESIRIMREMNAQGAITWDPEGQEFAHATSYIGDPRLVDTMAPEIAPVIDEYFSRFTKAGFRVGLCVRPQLLQLSADRQQATQTTAKDPTQLLIDKIAYARKRWGVTIIYLDSNTNSSEDPSPLDASGVQRVASTFTDCLLIPEHSNLRYYSYSIPYAELRGGRTGTPDAVRHTYPHASTLVYTADGPLDLYKAQLAEGIKHGDILMYRTWWPDPQNEKVKLLYK